MKLGATSASDFKLGSSQASKLYLGATEVWSGAIPYRTEVLVDSPTAYYRLGESSGTTATDEQGAHNATYIGAPTLGVAGAVVGNTSITTAVGKYGRKNTAVLNGSTPFTLEAWAKTSSAANQNVMAIGNASFTKYAGIYIAPTTGRAGVYANGNGGTTHIATSTSSFNDGGWHHIVGVVQSTGLQVYVDGALVGSLTQSITSATDYAILAIGAFTGGADPLIGSLDECAAYPTALSAARILAHYNARNNS